MQPPPRPPAPSPHKLRGNYQRESLGPIRTTQSELGNPSGRSENQASQFQANTVFGQPATALRFRTAAHSEPPTEPVSNDGGETVSGTYAIGFPENVQYTVVQAAVSRTTS